jgi:hypothetical protein
VWEGIEQAREANRSRRFHTVARRSAVCPPLSDLESIGNVQSPDPDF